MIDTFEAVTLLSIVEALLQLSMIIMVGLYFIFSNTVMRVLATHHNGAEVMNGINAVILNPCFCFCFPCLARQVFISFGFIPDFKRYRAWYSLSVLQL